MTNTPHDDSKSVPMKGPEIKRYMLAVSAKDDGSYCGLTEVQPDGTTRQATDPNATALVRYSDHLADRAADKVEIERLCNRPCPYVTSSREGTNCCTLPCLGDVEAAALRTQVEGLRDDLDDAYRMMTRYAHELPKDHACVRCVPWSDMIIADFVCPKHKALDRANALTPPADTEKEG